MHIRNVTKDLFAFASKVQKYSKETMHNNNYWTGPEYKYLKEADFFTHFIILISKTRVKLTSSYIVLSASRNGEHQK